MRGHVDSETLAAYREELLPRRKAGRVAAHLADCAQCAGRDAQLAGLPGLLAHTPAPPMPDALTARIEAALAAEAATRSAQAPAGVPGTEAAAGTSAAPAGPGAARGGRRQRSASGRSRLALRVAFAAAAVVVIAGGGLGVSRLLSGGPAVNGASSSAGTGSPVRGPGGAPAQSGGGANSSQGAEHSHAGGPGGASRTAPESATSYPVVTSGTNYRAGLLKTQVRTTLIRFQGRGPAHGSGTVFPAPYSPLAGCLAGITKGQRPRLVDMAHYEGKPATVVVVPAGAHTLRALVFGQRCPTAGASPLASTTLPSPG